MSRNRLGETASPYLRQHADNPVHWWPWTDAAFDEAKARQIPVHLSIGYAACHWCHVMADESFSDPDVAAYLNDHFVNIKVDREERPDVDQIYMKALHALGEQGGWPLTMFLSPDGEPFWGGTYFPPEPRWGRPSFQQLLQGISTAWQNGEKRITDNMAALVDHLGKLPEKGTDLPERAILNQATQNILSIWDHEKGGIRGAPKFPMSPLLDLIWRTGLRDNDTNARDAVLTTLRRMSSGGIYDHLAGGFARYSVDAEWLVPHFEKMLSDNGQLLSLLVRAWQATGEPVFRQRAVETANWMIKDMQLQGGGFAASLDADTEHEEGLTYVWHKAEVDSVLGPDSNRFCAVYDVQAAGNWEGKTILNRLDHDRNNPFDPAVEADLGALRARLLQVRQDRPQPARDDKVLSDWNALAISALAEAAVAFDDRNLLKAAKTAYSFILETMTDGENLAHSWCDGRITSDGLATDLAQMVRAAISLHAATGDPDYVSQAETWFDGLYKNYIDSGRVFLDKSDSALIVRPVGTQDDATPSAAGIAVQVAMHLLLLTGDSRYLDASKTILEAQSGQLSSDIVGSASLLSGYDAYLRPRLAYLAGAPGEHSESHSALKAAILAEADPSMLTLLNHADDQQTPHQIENADGMTVPAFFLCEGATCRTPITDPAEAKTALMDSRNV